MRVGTRSQTLIQTITLAELTNWSVPFLLERSFSYNDDYELVAIGDFLIRNKEVVEVQDDTEYKRVTIKINNNGVLLRDKAKGENIGTKRQYLVKAGQFILSKIDARNGAFGLIPEELEGAIVTNDFPSFEVDTKRINTQFLVLITTTREFVRFAQSCSSGTTNRQRIDVDLFLQQKIPLPSMEEQNRIVAAYQQKVQQAEQQEVEAKGLEYRIEKSLLERLGIEGRTKRNRTLGINVFNDKDFAGFEVIIDKVLAVQSEFHLSIPSGIKDS